MKVKLTDTGLRSYQPRAKQYAIGDAACPGLHPGHTGRHQDVRLRLPQQGHRQGHLAHARPLPGRAAGQSARNRQRRPQDRCGRRHAADAQGRARRSGKKTKTYAELVELYFDAKLSTLRSGNKSRLTLQRIGRVYGWNERPVVSITDDDAAAMLHDIADRRGKRSMANQTKHIVHAMFKWAKQPGRKFVTANPFADLAAPGGAKVTRDRFLSAAEIRQIWSALDEPERFGVSQDAATALRLILETAARPGMVRGMVGSELRDLSGPSEHGPHWSLPAERMKAGSAFITPLSGLALELLRPHLKADPDAPIFAIHENHLHEAAQQIVAGLAMERWTPHDLRRTAATILDRAGYSLEQIGALLAHTRKGVTAVYARWDKFDLRREMATVVEQSLRETLDGEPTTAIKAAA